MKILQIIQRDQLRGAEIFACQLSEALQQLGHEVDVLILFGKKTNGLQFNLPFYCLEANEQKRLFDFKGYHALSQFVIKGKYDIVQANAGDTLKYTTLSKKIFGWPNPLYFRNANKISGFLTTSLKKIFNRWLMKEVDFVASVSNECMLDFLTLYPSFSNRIASLPIGTKINENVSVSMISDLDIKKPALLHVGSFVPEKNHLGLIEIFSEVLQKHPSATLYLIGEGRLRLKIEQLVKEKKLTEKVVFLGKRNDVDSIMKLCDILLLPSLIEGLPGVILEAFANRLSVIAYDTGGIKEVVIPEYTGYLIAKNDPTNFVNAIDEQLQNPCTKIVDNAYNLVHSNYTITAVAKKFNEFYLTTKKDTSL